MSKKPPGEPPKKPNLKLVPKTPEPKAPTSSRAAKDPADRTARKMARDAAQKEFDRQDRAKAAKESLDETRRKVEEARKRQQAHVEQGRTRRPAANDPEFQRKPQPKPHQRAPTPAESAEKRRQKMIKMESNPKTPPRNYTRTGRLARSEVKAEELVDNMRKGKVAVKPPTAAEQMAKTRRIVKGSMDSDRRRFRVEKSKTATKEVVQGLKQSSKPTIARTRDAQRVADKAIEQAAGRTPSVKPPVDTPMTPKAQGIQKPIDAYQARTRIASAAPGTARQAVKKGVVGTVAKTMGKAALRYANPAGALLTGADIVNELNQDDRRTAPLSQPWNRGRGQTEDKPAPPPKNPAPPPKNPAPPPKKPIGAWQTSQPWNRGRGMAKGGKVKASKAYREFKR